MTDNPAAELVSVTKKLGRVRALDNMSFTVGRGEIVGLLGPNGSGKTTAMKILCGLLFPDSGKRAAYCSLSALIETPCFYDRLSGYENLLYAAAISGRGKRETEEVIEQLGLSAYIRKRAGRCSMGMRQKLGIARVLLSDADLLILDEPTNGLDPFATVQLREILRTLSREEGKSILVSSHILGEMQKTCDRVLFFKEGRILAEQTVSPDRDLENLYVSFFREGS